MKVYSAQAASPLHDDNRCEDVCLTYSDKHLCCVVACDGVSACKAGGKKAAEISANTIVELLRLKPKNIFKSPELFFESALQRICEKLMRYAKTKNVAITELGTTIACLIIQKDTHRYVSLNLGDSSTIIMKRGDFYKKLSTIDHPNGSPYTLSTVDLLLQKQEKITNNRKGKGSKFPIYVVSKGHALAGFVMTDGAYIPISVENKRVQGIFKNRLLANMMSVSSLIEYDDAQNAFQEFAKILSESSLDDASFGIISSDPKQKDRILAQFDEYSFSKKEKQKLVHAIKKINKLCEKNKYTITFSISEKTET